MITVPSFVTSEANLRSSVLAFDEESPLVLLLLLHAAKVTNEAAPNKPAIAFLFMCFPPSLDLFLEYLRFYSYSQLTAT